MKEIPAQNGEKSKKAGNIGFPTRIKDIYHELDNLLLFGLKSNVGDFDGLGPIFSIVTPVDKDKKEIITVRKRWAVIPNSPIDIIWLRGENVSVFRVYAAGRLKVMVNNRHIRLSGKMFQNAIQESQNAFSIVSKLRKDEITKGLLDNFTDYLEKHLQK